MKSLRKMFKERRLKAHSKLRDSCQPLFLSINSKLRLPARIRIANIWCTHHPRKMAAYSISSLLLCFLLCFVNVRPKANGGNSSPGGIFMMDTIFTKYSELNSVRTYYKNQVKDFTEKSLMDVNEFDSLMKLKHKSPEDSLRLKRLAVKLKVINNALKAERNEKNQL